MGEGLKRICKRHGGLTARSKDKVIHYNADGLLHTKSVNEEDLTAVEKALMVLVKTPHIRAYLKQKDPKALNQAEEALKSSPGQVVADFLDMLREYDAQDGLSGFSGFPAVNAAEVLLGRPQSQIE